MVWQVKTKNRRRWSFGKSSHQPSATEVKEIPSEKKEDNRKYVSSKTPDSKYPTNRKSTPVRQMTTLSKYRSPEDWAAIRIQTAFRAYLVQNSIDSLYHFLHYVQWSLIQFGYYCQTFYWGCTIHDPRLMCYCCVYVALGSESIACAEGPCAITSLSSWPHSPTSSYDHITLHASASASAGSSSG